MERPGPTRVPILMYHQVGRFPREVAYRHTGIHADAERFRRQVALLRKLGYSSVTLAQLSDWLEGRAPLPARSVCLTFDDAYRNVFQHALPVLQAASWPATTFVVTGRIDGSNDWDHASGIAPSPLMNATELRELSRAGWEVAAHSRSHPRLPTLNDEALRAEIAGSREDLVTLLGEAPRTFCYPYGAADERCVTEARQAGYAAAVTTARGAARHGGDAFRLPRLGIGYRVTALRLAWRVEKARRFG